ncbi:13091_t:CDS:2 [Acaulospora morrowiae]|uniref:13091_t:CDS:1 n=1 Tax=Acaulospora morrowiae TaxID=94023 RepID=A0A9N9B0M0_9GLOM|nr:13091_t:CDS:2 [Acaulospora morrowiae]
MSWDIRVVVGLDFGTTYSGFTYRHVDGDRYITNDRWPGERGQCQFKTNTVLQYEENLTDVKAWGYPALSKRPSSRSDKNERTYVVELFKLHLGDLDEEHRRRLSTVVDYKKAITDYLREIGMCMKRTVESEWEGIEFLKHALLVITVPAEYPEGAKAIMRECAYNAGLIADKKSEQLQFTTEPEAAAIYCMDNLREHDLETSGTIFMIVDCGGGTVDLTTRKLLDKDRLGEITVRAGDYCGSTFIDAEFIKYLREELGEVMDMLENSYYGQMQYMIQEFCRHVKLPFTGDDPDFSFIMNLEEVAPILSLYASDEVKRKMDEKEWMIRLDYATIKSMFDPVVERILRMISAQLDNCREKCSIMFLVGGFGQSVYLQNRIKQEFLRHRVDNISVPTNPIAAISRGAAIYGQSFRHIDDTINMNGLKFIIDSRVLKFTYGVKILSAWKPGDPPERNNGFLYRFYTIVRKGTEVKTDEEFSADNFCPCFPFQKTGLFEIYYTREYDANFIDEPGMKLLGKLKIDWPDVELGTKRPTTFKLTFGRMEITATANNRINGQTYQTTLEINAED